MAGEKAHPLGKRLGIYKESRMGIPILIVVLAICGTIFMFQSNTAEDQNLLYSLLSVGGFCTLPVLVVGGLIWFLVERFLPRKTLVLYQDGLQLLSRQGLETYPWQAIPDVTWTAVKSEGTNKILQYKYQFIKKDDHKKISFMSSSYPGLDKSPLHQLLKQAHSKGILNVTTETEWQNTDISSGD